MKEHTKAVLEACTGHLVALGMTRWRRNLAVWSMNDEMYGGISMQVQTRTGVVTVIPIAHVLWEPIEQLVAHGKGKRFTPWGRMSITRSRPVVPPRQVGRFEFKEPVIDGIVLERFARFAQRKVVREVLDLADERALLSHFRSNANKGGGRAEHALAIRAWQTKSLDLSEDYGSLLTAQTDFTYRVRLERFHHRLVASSAARELLGASGPVPGPIMMG